MTPFSTRSGLPSSLSRWRSPLNDLAGTFARIAVAAGDVVMHVYGADPTVRRKADSSPVCEADERAEAFILAQLHRLAPDLPVLAEEAAARGEIPALDGRFILVDPVDGTKEFLNRNGEFTVNIALVDHGIPIAGAIFAPALDKLWFAGDQAFAATIATGADIDGCETLHRIESRAADRAGLTVMASRSHVDAETEAFLARLPVADRRSAGSSLKFCALAEGVADLYPRFGPTMEWDTAAGHAILRAAGGVVLAEGGEDLRYGKSDQQFRNGGFTAWGRRDDAVQLIDAPSH